MAIKGLCPDWLWILAVRWRMLRNIFKDFKKRWFLNLGLALLLAIVIFGGGFAFFYNLVFFILFQEQFQPFGAVLAIRLMGLAFMVFFTMLLFSNIVSVLATVYFSREVPFLMSLPVSHSSVFWAKFMESLIYSSWALIMMSLPLLFSFALRKHGLLVLEYEKMLSGGDVQKAAQAFVGVPKWFAVAGPLAFMVFASIPAFLAAALTLVMTSWLPARRARVLLIGLVLLFGAGSWPMVSRLVDTVKLVDTSAPSPEDFQTLLDGMMSSMPKFLPHRWLSDAINSMSGGGEAGQSFLFGIQAQAPAIPTGMDERLFWNGLLLSTACMLFVLVSYLAPSLYFRGWAMCGYGGRRVKDRGWSVIDGLKFALVPFPRSVRGLVMKDFKTFFRDPGQWIQLVILFGLLTIYVANLRSMPEGINSPFWQNVLSFFNLAATCFVASTMATRFAYPLLSLEGRQAWVIGLAPIRSTSIVWQKYWLCWFGCAVAVGTIMVISSATISLNPLMKWICYGTSLLITLGLSSLAVGFGALMPDFDDDNPASIANNLGGTIVIVSSMAYVGLTTFLEAVLVDLYAVKQVISSGRFGLGLAVLGCFNAAVIVIPMWLAIRKWRSIEFL